MIVFRLIPLSTKPNFSQELGFFYAQFEGLRSE